MAYNPVGWLRVQAWSGNIVCGLGNWSTKLPCDAAMQFDQRSCGSQTGNGTIICKAVTLPDFLFFSRRDGGVMEMKLCEMVLWRTVLI